MIPKALKICASNVARAAPDTFILTFTIKKISKTILMIDAIARNNNGILEFPNALSNEAK